MSLVTLILLMAAFWFGFQWFMYRMRFKAIEKFLGRDFIRVISRPSDGIFLTILDDGHDGDFIFVPHGQTDGTFYKVKFREGNNERVYDFKIPKRDTFTIRNRFKAAIVLKEHIRALNPKHLATFTHLDEETKRELLQDYETFSALKETYNKLTKKLKLAEDVETIKKLTKELKKIKQEMDTLRQKWVHGVVQKIPLEEALAVVDEDEGYITIYRPVDLDYLEDTISGVHPTVVYQTALQIFNDWYQEVLKEFGRAFGLAKARAQQSSFMKWLIIAGGAMMLMMLVLRGLGGGG